MLRAAAGLACRVRSNTKLPQICASAVSPCADFPVMLETILNLRYAHPQARGYAAESAPEQDTTVSLSLCSLAVVWYLFSKTDACYYILQPPITVHGIPGRYASALYTSAAKAGKLEAVQEELVEVKHGQ